ncbi:dTDP-4-dehydrorhamnose 3,5-epimerase [Lentibacillus sp. N15]|uniref:dTDP-4-dehydrorhamnose 3,5-epimerase n=1 Tax=Lentibacillus songyuanensis TaxID=3136161 RepID=UPI0031BAA2B1
MKIIETNLTGVKVIEPSVFGDHRGWFMETHNYTKLKEEGININFIQDNQSYSAVKGTLRGLHYQLNPKAQAKIVRCTRGAIFDVAVDIRKGSPEFGKWVGVELTEENKKQLLIPKGFAHGFITITKDVEVQYKVDNDYAPECEGGVIWNDPTIGIEWPVDVEPILSEKDKVALTLDKAKNNFTYGE